MRTYRTDQKGIALLMVIFIIAGVAVIAAPLAYTMLAQEDESAQLIENSRSDVAARGARNHAIDFLGSRVAEWDQTKFSDVPYEYVVADLGPGNSIIKNYIDGFNSVLVENVAWGATVTDLQSKVNLNTITPLMCENLIGRRLRSLYNYRIAQQDGTYRLFRSVYEARRTGITPEEMDALARYATVWSGPNIYGNYFSREIPASVDFEGNISVFQPGVQDMLACGTVIRVQLGAEEDYEVYFVRIDEIIPVGERIRLITDPAVRPTEHCTLRASKYRARSTSTPASSRSSSLCSRDCNSSETPHRPSRCGTNRRAYHRGSRGESHRRLRPYVSPDNRDLPRRHTAGVSSHEGHCMAGARAVSARTVHRSHLLQQRRYFQDILFRCSRLPYRRRQGTRQHRNRRRSHSTRRTDLELPKPVRMAEARGSGIRALSRHAAQSPLHLPRRRTLHRR
ncbi:MAG: hypothetical protein U5N86_00780 [Planctomycetota bacterium]|nr:hypothetical protein [Planctomycetota bacterium]